jgi:hypothetical protein
LELKHRNLGLKDIRAASTVDEGVNGQSSGDIPVLREPVAKETVDFDCEEAVVTIVEVVFKVVYIAFLLGSELVFELR